MKTQYEKVVSDLNDLIKLHNDREKGYLDAAEAMREAAPQLAPLLEQLAEESRQFSADLETRVKAYLGTPAEGQTFQGKMHQAWLSLKAGVTGKDRDAILSSCEFGDKALIEAYEMALEDEKIQAIAELRAELESQVGTIRHGRRLVEALETPEPPQY
jgi:uncharacterized protein (TIGR02284 family)